MSWRKRVKGATGISTNVTFNLKLPHRQNLLNISKPPRPLQRVLSVHRGSSFSFTREYILPQLNVLAQTPKNQRPRIITAQQHLKDIVHIAAINLAPPPSFSLSHIRTCGGSHTGGYGVAVVGDKLRANTATAGLLWLGKVRRRAVSRTGGRM